jgi:hypothetical protein
MVISKQPDIQSHTFNPILSSNLIPTPSAAYQLRDPDPRFEESEKFTFRIANYMSNNLDKSQRKVIRRLGGNTRLTCWVDHIFNCLFRIGQ